LVPHRASSGFFFCFVLGQRYLIGLPLTFAVFYLAVTFVEFERGLLFLAHLRLVIWRLLLEVFFCCLAG
jgi:hypothetical protein